MSILSSVYTASPRLLGPRLSGSSQYWDIFSGFFWIYRVKLSSITGKKFDYRDFSRKIPIIEVNKCSVVNLKIQLSGFFEIFGHPCPDNRGPPVLNKSSYF